MCMDPLLQQHFTFYTSKLDISYHDAKLIHPAESGVAPEAVAEAFHNFEQGGSKVAPLSAAAVSNQSIQESMRLLLLVRAYQVYLLLDCPKTTPSC